MKRTNVFLILLTISIGAGLTMSNRIIDEIHIVTVVGYDHYEDDKFRGTVVIPVFSPDKKVENITFTETSSLIYENRAKLNESSSKPLLSGKLEVALFNEELAKRGIIDYVDNLERDPNIGSHVFLAIVKGKTEKMLKKSYENIPVGRYISDLLKQNIKIGDLPTTNLHLFTKHFFAEGIDPVLPLVAQKNDKIQIVALALFKDDKYVDKIDFEKAFALKMLSENFGRGTFTVMKNEKPFAAIENVESKRTYKVKNQRTAPEIKINIHTKGFIKEYIGDIVDEKRKSEVERLMEEQIEREAQSMIKKFQELNIDPIGLGTIVKSKTRNWDYKQWRELYPNAIIKVEADVLINESGVIK